MESIVNKKLIVCDVCDTLYKSNTTFDFLKYLAAHERGFRFFLLQVISSKRFLLFYLLAIAGKIIKLDIIRLLSLRLLQGLKYSFLNKKANEFYDQFLFFKRNEVIFNLLEKEKERSHLILVSSSLDVVIKVIAERNKFNWASSQMEVLNGIATGKLKNDLTGKKQIVATQIMKEMGIQKLMVITDNRTDKELVEMADERYIVIKSTEEREYWSSLNPHFILI